MTRHLPPWTSRAAALGLLALVLAVIYGIVLAPLFAAYGRTDKEVTEASDMLGRYQRVAAMHGALQARLDELAARQEESGIYLSGDTDALAAASLQDMVNAAVESGGGRQRSLQILPVENDGEFKRLGVRVQMTASIGEIARILYSLEAGKTFLFVDNLEISNRQARRRTDGVEMDPELLIRMDVLGYLRPEAA